MTVSITALYHHAECHYAECRYAECHYAERQYAECRGALRSQLALRWLFSPCLIVLKALPGTNTLAFCEHL